jgi:hypothetical protein
VARIPRPPKDGAARIAAPDDGSGLRTGNRMLLAGLARIDGYAGLEPARELDYHDPRALQLAGVGWIFHSQAEGNGGRHQWTELPAAAARVRLLPWADSGSSDTPANAQGTVIVLHDRPGQIELEYESTERMLVATTESFHRGWSATVDGEPATVVRVSHDFLGCGVPAGKHRVELAFRPRSLHVGRWLTASGLGLMVCAVVARLLFRSV